MSLVLYCVPGIAIIELHILTSQRPYEVSMIICKKTRGTGRLSDLSETSHLESDRARVQTQSP